MSQKAKDNILKSLIYLATGLTMGILLFILGFIFIKGIGLVNVDFLTRNFNEKVSYVFVESADVPATTDVAEINAEKELDSRYETLEEGPIYVENLGIAISKVYYENHSTKREQFVISYIEKDSPMLAAVNANGAAVDVGTDYILQSINDKDFSDLTLEEVASTMESQSGELKIKIVEPGGGIYSNIITTLYMVLLSLVIALPIGIFGAIYLTEYAKPGRLVNTIRFAAETLSGIPSIIFGLFGMAFFVVSLKLQISLISGSLTVAIILLPVIIRSTEEALKTVPMSFREGSLALGATKLQTIFKVVLPCAIPGIATAVLLSIGRVIGESAALLLTAGTVAQIPSSLLSPGSTLTVQAYYVAKEEGNIELACAIGVVIIVVVIVLNLLSRLATDKLDVFNKK